MISFNQFYKLYNTCIRFSIGNLTLRMLFDRPRAVKKLSNKLSTVPKITWRKMNKNVSESGGVSECLIKVTKLCHAACVLVQQFVSLLISFCDKLSDIIQTLST